MKKLRKWKTIPKHPRFKLVAQEILERHVDRIYGDAQTVGGIDALILALRAGGGYKYRSMLQIQDGKNLNTLIATAEVQLRSMAKSLEVAEAMLHEPAPSMVHPRWDEYQGRREEALKQMIKKREGT